VDFVPKSFSVAAHDFEGSDCALVPVFDFAQDRSISSVTKREPGPVSEMETTVGAIF
jgi:hypothetical protein